VLRSSLADDLAANELAPGYVRPDYDGYCFANVPGTAGRVLGSDVAPALPDDVFADVDTDPSTVVVVLVDALGFDHASALTDEHDLMAAFADEGTVTPLTSTYPSETAACVTTMQTGRYPVEHGLLGWNAYDPEADAVYASLPFQAADGGDLELDPEKMADGDTVFDRLAADGVDCHTVQAFETPTDAATDHTIETLGEFAATLANVVEDAADEERSFVYAYYSDVDSTGHHVGPDHLAYRTEGYAVLSALERAFADVSERAASETLLTLTADHGQVDTTGGRVALESVDGVLDEVATDRSGVPLVLGAPRNVHFHVDGDRSRVREALESLDALVYTREEALDIGLWGPGEPGPAFERNCGDLVAIPREGALWYREGNDELDLVGMHGGLNEREMLVPFAAARLSDLG